MATTKGTPDFIDTKMTQFESDDEENYRNALLVPHLEPSLDVLQKQVELLRLNVEKLELQLARKSLTTTSMDFPSIIAKTVSTYRYCSSRCDAAHTSCDFPLPLKEQCFSILDLEFDLRNKFSDGNIPTKHEIQLYLECLDMTHRCLRTSLKKTVLDTICGANTPHNLLFSIPIFPRWHDAQLIILEWLYPTTGDAYRLRQVTVEYYLPIYEWFITWLNTYIAPARRNSCRVLCPDAVMTDSIFANCIMLICLEVEYSPEPDPWNPLLADLTAPYKPLVDGPYNAFKQLIADLRGLDSLDTGNLFLEPQMMNVPVNFDADALNSVMKFFKNLTALYDTNFFAQTSIVEKFTGLVLTIYNIIRGVDTTHRMTILAQFLLMNGFLSICRIKDFVISLLPDVVACIVNGTAALALVGFCIVLIGSLIRMSLGKSRNTLEPHTDDPIGNAFSDDNFPDTVDRLYAQFKESKGIMNFLKNFNTIKATVSSAEYLTNFMTEIFYRTYFYLVGEPFYTSEAHPHVTSALKWMKEIHTEFISTNNEDLAASLTLSHRIIQYYKDGVEISDKLTAVGFKETYMPSFFNVLREFKALYEEAEFYVTNASSRPVPLWIHFIGQPATGKSALTQIILNDIWEYYNTFIHKQDLPFNANLRYERNVNEKFWSGYSHQPFVTIDDIWTLDDAEVRSRTAADIIHMINSNPFNLDMGSLADKGKTMFDSMVVISNSNGQGLPKNINIQDKDAFCGRRDFLLEVTIAKSHIREDSLDPRDKIKIDEEKARPIRQMFGEKPGDKFTRAAYVFTLRDSLTEQPLKIFDYPEMLMTICKRLAEKQSSTTSVHEFAVRTKPKFEQMKHLIPQVLTNFKTPYTHPSTMEPTEEERIRFEQYREARETISKSDSTTLPPTHIVNIIKDYENYRNKLEDGVDLDPTPPSTEPAIRSPSPLPPGPPPIYNAPIPPQKAPYFEKIKALLQKIKDNLRKKVVSFNTEMGKVAEKVKEFCSKHWTILLLIPLYIGGIAIGVKFLCNEFGNPKTVPHNETGASGGGYTSKPTTKLDVRRFNSGAQLVPHDSNTEDLLKSVVRRNGAYVRAKNSNSELSLQTCFVFDRVCPFPAHYWDAVEDVIEFTPVNTSRNPFNIRKNTCNVFRDTQNDLVLVGLPSFVQPFSDISSHFYTIDLINKADLNNVVVYKNVRDSFDRVSESIVVCNSGSLASTVSYPSRGKIYTSHFGIRYRGSFQKGDCGSFVAIANPKIAKKFVGIHVAGSDRQGRCSIITSDDLDAAKVFFNVTIEPQMTTITDAKPEFEYKHWKFEGSVPKELGIRYPSKSQIEKSVAFELFQNHKKAPARLTPFTDANGEKKSPLQLAIFKMEKPATPPINYALAKEIAETWMEGVTNRFPACVLSEYEAINGVPYSRFNGPIDMSTSVGYLGVPTHGMSHKSDWFYGTPSNYTPSPIISQRIELLKNSYLNKKYHVAVTQAHLKDELRDLARVADGKTRLFTCPETSHLVLSKRYFGAFIENVGLNAVPLGVALGINPSSYDWEDVHAAKSSVKPSFELDGDSSCHDGCANPEYAQIFAEVINAWYRRFDPGWTEEDDLIRTGLIYDATFFALLQIGCDLVSVIRFLASGVLFTYIFQSFTTHIIHRMTLIRVGQALGIKVSVPETFKYSFLTAGGDDYIHSLHERFRWYTFALFQEYVKELGYTYTPPDKSSGTYDQREVDDVDFLKRRFVWKNGVCLAPLDLETVLEIISWKKKGISDRDAYEASMQSVLYELYHHGRLVFDQYYDIFAHFSAANDLPRPYLTYDYISSELRQVNYERSVFDEEELVPHMQEIHLTDHESIALLEVDLRSVTSYADAYYKVFKAIPEIEYTYVNHQYLATIRFRNTFFKSAWCSEKRLSRESALHFLFEDLLKNCAPSRLPRVPPPETINAFVAAYIQRYHKQPDFQLIPKDDILYCVLIHEEDVYLGKGPTSELAIKNSIEKLLLEDEIVPHSSQAENIQEVTEGEVVTEQLTTMKDAVGTEHGIDIGRFQPILATTDPYPDQGLTTVLSRQYRIASFTWSGSVSAGTSLGYYSFPYQVISTSLNFARKIFAFKWMRCNWKIKIVINGTQFHYGKLLGAWLPHNSTNSTTLHWKLGNMWTASTCNAFTISANTNQTVEVTIPYTIPLQYWDVWNLALNQGDMGTIIFYVLNPLNLTGSTSTPSLTVSLFACADDIRVAGPSLSANTFSDDPRLLLARKIMPKLFENDDDNNFVPQMKKRTVKNTNAEAEKKGKSGIISNALNVGSNVAAIVGTTGLLGPEVSLGAEAVSGLLGGISSLASSLGFNKPPTVQSTPMFQQVTFSNLMNGNGEFSGMELGMEVGGRLSTDADSFMALGIPTKITELSSRPGLFAQTTFDSTYAPGTVFFKHYVTPATCYTTINSTGTALCSALTPCAAVASMFKYGRGTMKYRIEIVCSKFTVGRARITWHPTWSEIPAIGSTIGAGEGDVVSQVFDFAGDTSINFTIPYLHALPMIRMYDPHLKSDDGSVGGVSYSIVIPTVTGETTASTTVYCNFYCATGPDYKFSVLADKAPFGTNKVRTFSQNGTFGTIIVPQMGDVEEITTNVLDAIFSYDFPTLIPGCRETMFEKLSVPETYDDIYTLVHKPVMQAALLPALTNTFTLIALPNGNKLDPYYFTQASFPMFLFNLWANYYKGGYYHYIQLAGIPTAVGDYQDIVTVLFNVSNGTVVVPTQNTTSALPNNTPLIMQHVNDRTGIMVHAPYRSMLPFSSFVQNTYVEGITGEQVLGAYFTTTGSEVLSPAYWFVSCDDDFRYSFFAGCPYFVQN
jgi:hypothetical protein